MSFLAPWMLIGAAAGSIPVILHFFYRARYRPVPWGAMKFLRLSVEQTSRRLRFQEWVLLVLRILVLLLLALALARPASLAITGAGGRGESVDAIIVIDNSYSMAAREGGKTRFQRAKEGALSIIEDLPQNSTVQIITCSDRAKYHGPKNPSNVDQAKQLIEKLEISQQSSDFFAGLNEAVEGFKRCQGGNKEVFLISDMQKLGWERQSSAVRAKCAEIKDQANLYLMRCTDRNIKNVSVTGIIPQTGIPHTGTRTAFTVLIHNGGTETVTKLNVTLEVDGKPLEKDAQVIERIDPGEIKAVTLTGKLDVSGWRLLTARVHPDDLDEDNRFDKIILVRDQVRVLVIDGTPNDREPEKSASFFLGHALLPVPDNLKPTYHIQPRVVRPQEASGPMLADKDVCILANVSLERGLTPDFVQKLSDWVREGHGLIITSGSNLNAATYNRVLGPKPQGVDLLPLTLGANFKATTDQPLTFDLNSIEGQSFLGKFKEAPLNQIARVETTQIIALNDKQEDGGPPVLGQVSLRFTGSKPAVVTRQIGDGEVMMLSTTFDLNWGILPLHPTATPLLHTMLTHLIQRSSSPYNRVAGETIRFAPSDAYRNYYLLKPNAPERISLGKPKQEANDKFFVSTSDTNLAGVYTIIGEAEPSGTRFAVTPDLRETENLESLKEEEIDQVIGFRPTHITLGQAFTSYAEERSKREWTIWILMAMFIFACGEAAWAWLCGRTW
jgi:hypothetical protein